MPKSLRCKIKKLCYNGTLTERERDRILKALEQEPREEDIHREREQAYMLGYEDASKKFSTEPCEDCISRQKALDCFEQTNTRQGAKYAIETLPSVIPQYTDEEIDKAQAVEQAYVDKMVELAVEETKRPKGKWIDDLITKVLTEVDGGTDDLYIRYNDICERIETSIKEFFSAEMGGTE